MANLSVHDDLLNYAGVEELSGFLDLSEREIQFFASTEAHNRLPVRLSPHLLRRMAIAAADHGGKLPEDHPLRRQFIPTGDELTVLHHELADPLGEESHSPLPRLIHAYPDRALLLVTDQCAVHCRHCLRSRFTGTGQGAITSREVTAVANYLGDHREVQELILSGGDALMLADRALGALLEAIRTANPGIVFRIATRLPVMLPERITPELVQLIRRFVPAWIVVQVNHAQELDSEAEGAIARLIDAGLPVISQTVLLSGVNDDPAILEELFTALVRLRVKPYYLFQGDLAPGTSHFRVRVERALEIVAELRGRLSGLAMPVFAVDIPGGAGKVRLEPSALVGKDDAGYQLRASDGSIHHYPEEGR